MGTNWFMPALVNSRLGESGMRLEDGTMVCCFDLKKSRNDWRIWVLVIMAKSSVEPSRTTALKASWKFFVRRGRRRCANVAKQLWTKAVVYRNIGQSNFSC